MKKSLYQNGGDSKTDSSRLKEQGALKERYLNSGYSRYSPLDERELEKECGSGEDIEEINYRRLQLAAKNLFAENKRMNAEEISELTKRFYSSLNLTERGNPNLLLDAMLLIDYFARAVRRVNAFSQENNDRRSMVIGCGNGRLASLHIELAKKTGVKEVWFNDLVSQHIENTRNGIKKVYGISDSEEDPLVIDGVKVNFLEGDFNEVSQQFDASTFHFITAIWFMTSEILDLSSGEALRKRRVSFFEKISRLLQDQGVFIEDIPEASDAGFYRLSRLKTHMILTEMGILQDEGCPESINLSLSNIPNKESHPYHIRYMAFNGGHKEEMEAAGLQEVTSTVYDIPETAQVDPRTLDWSQLFSRHSINEVLTRIRSMYYNFTSTDQEKVAAVRQKRFTLWSTRVN